jgi:glucokinase
MILAGDIGGTKTNLALFETDGQSVGASRAQGSFPSAGHDSLNAIIKEFLVAHQSPERITHACFGIAGPVVAGHVKAPNLAWAVEAASLAAQLEIERVKLINDLEATAAGVESLAPDRIHTLNEGDSSHGGNRALIAAGTGLGMAGIVLHEGRYQPLASEGGHIDFAPRNELEIDLLHYLFERFGAHASYERALSGPGLFNVYSFLRDRKYAEEPAWLREEIESSDNKTGVVSNAALAQKSELAVKALDVFVSIYGAVAGNLALLMVARGGLYVGGGIAPKILTKLKDGTFMNAFKGKGRLSSFTATIPVRVILDDKTAVYGAARSALY